MKSVVGALDDGKVSYLALPSSKSNDYQLVPDNISIITSLHED